MPLNALHQEGNAFKVHSFFWEVDSVLANPIQTLTYHRLSQRAVWGSVFCSKALWYVTMGAGIESSNLPIPDQLHH